VDRSDSPLFTVKPQYRFLLLLYYIWPFLLFFAVFLGGFFGMAGSFLLHRFVAFRQLKLNLPPGFPLIFITWSILAFSVGLPIFMHVATKKSVEKTEYMFFQDRVECRVGYAGFFSRQEKFIRYGDIIEVSFQRNMLQRRYGLGTILFLTRAKGGVNQGVQAGADVSDIENPEAVYGQVKQLIGLAK